MKVLKEREVKVIKYKTSSGSEAYEVRVSLTKDMLWLHYPKKFKIRYIEDNGEKKIELIPIYEDENGR